MFGHLEASVPFLIDKNHDHDDFRSTEDCKNSDESEFLQSFKIFKILIKYIKSGIKESKLIALYSDQDFYFFMFP